jgi:hypothetical protein
MTRRSAPLLGMRLSSLGAVAIIGLLALIGGVAGYQYVAADNGPTTTAAVTHPKHVRVVGKPVVHIKVRHCRHGYVRKGRTCVRHVDRTVVVDVPAPPTSAPAPVAVPAPASAPASVTPQPPHPAGVAEPSHRPARDGSEHTGGDGGGEHESSGGGAAGGGAAQGDD